MTSEEYELLKENNALLKQIYTMLVSMEQNRTIKDFIINVLANKVANNTP